MTFASSVMMLFKSFMDRWLVVSIDCRWLKWA